MEQLEVAISPTRAWEILRSGVEGFTDAAIRSHLRAFAIAIVRHKQLMARGCGDSYHEDDPLLRIVCIIHGVIPEPGALLSIERFILAPFLALGMWDSLYYALIADVRALYEYAMSSGSGAVLHNQGSTANANNQSFTVDDLRVLLNNVWSFLIDPRLLGPLEIAVKIHKLAENFRTAEVDHTFRHAFRQVWDGYAARDKEEILNRTDGMLDVARISIDKIHEDLRSDYFRKLRRACEEELGIPYPATEQGEGEDQGRHQQKLPEPQTSLKPSNENPCCCARSCGCRLVCQYGIHGCECKATMITTVTTMRQKTRHGARSAPAPDQSSSPSPANSPLRARTNTTGSQQHHHHHHHHHGVQYPRNRQGGKEVYPTEFYASRRGSPPFAPSSPEPFPPAQPSTTPPPSHPVQNSPRTPAEALAAGPNLSGWRHLVSAGGEMPLSQREVFPDGHLPQPEQGGWAMTREQFEALPPPRRASAAAAGGEARPPRRPSWVKRIFSRSEN